MSPKPKLFIGSSSRALPHVKTLVDLLGDRISCRPWNRLIGSTGSVLARLCKECREADFSAILLTRDDFAQRRSADRYSMSRRVKVPRDNCIFELGLFLAGLGFDYDRNFLLSAVPEESLPSDLRGYIYIPIRDSGVRLKSSLRDAAEQIIDSISKHVSRPVAIRRPVLPMLSREQLLACETKGDRPRQVLVRATEPIESDLRFAPEVLGNMCRGVKYEYYFDVDPKKPNLERIGSMIQTLAVATVIRRSIWRHATESKKLDLMRLESKNIIDNAARMGKQLSIILLSQPASEEFCLHIRDGSRLDGYLRWDGGQFVVLTDSGARMKVSAYQRHRKISPLTVFYFGRKNSRTTRSELFKEVRSKFPKEVHDAVLRSILA